MSDTERDDPNKDRDITEGDRWTADEHDGSTFTTNPTSDPQYPEGSSYISRTSSDGEKDPTMIVSPEGDILNEADDES